MGARLIPLFLVLAAAAVPARARAEAAAATDAEDLAGAAGDDEADEAFLAKYAPPPVEGPALRWPVTPTRLYVDSALAYSDDLSALPYIEGSGSNIRFAFGGSWRWRRFAFSGEVPYPQITTLTVTQTPTGTPIPEDMHQTAVSLGDIRVGADWTERLPWGLTGGFGLRARLPTHTTRFQFHLLTNELASYSFPYYFHVEPTAILGAKVGDFVFVVNQGAVVLLGPDGDFGDQHIVVPTIVYWDAHYAATWAPLEVLAASVEVATDIQLNHVNGVDFQKLNDVRSVWIAPSLQLHLGDYRVDAIARFGVTRGADLFGVIEYAGTTSYTLRVSRTFN